MQSSTRSTLTRRVATALVLILAAAGRSFAQTPARSFEELGTRISVGRGVVVSSLTATGKVVRTKGRILQLTSADLVVKSWRRTTHFNETEVVQIAERYVSPRAVAIGAAVGAAAGLALDRWLVQTIGADTGMHGDDLAIVGVAALAGAGLGSMPHLRLIFRRSGATANLKVTPLFGQRRSGIAVSIRF